MGTSKKESSNKAPAAPQSTNVKEKKDIKLHADAKEFVPHKPVVRFIHSF